MADTQATLSVGVKVVDQLTPEMKKIADNATRESNRAAQAVGKIGTGFTNVRSSMRAVGQQFSQVAGLFGFGALAGFSLGSIGNMFEEMQRDIEKAARSLYTFSRAQRSVGLDGSAMVETLKRQADALRTVYGGNRADFTGGANIGRQLGLDGRQLTEALATASELSSAYGVDLASAMQAVTEATLGTQDGYKNLGGILGVLIRDADDAERALQRLRLEGERTRLQYRGASFSPTGFNSENASRISEIDRLLGSLGSSRPAPNARAIENAETRKLAIAGIDRLVSQRDALEPTTTLYDKNRVAEIQMNVALIDLNKSVLDLQKTIELRNQGSRDPVLDQFSATLGLERDNVAAGIERRYRETVARNTLEEELARAERDLQARQLYDRDPRYADRGAGRAVADIKAEYEDLNQRAYESVRYFATSLENNLGDAFTSILNGSKNVGDALRALFQGLVADLTKEAGKEAGKFIVGAIFGAGSPAKAGAGDLGMISGGEGFSSSSIISSARFLTAYRHAPFRALADGGVLNRPTLAVAGENGPEVFMPLRGGKVPVVVQGGGLGGTNVVNVQLNVSAWDAQDAARGVSKAMPQIVASVQKALSSDRGFRNAVKSL